MVTLCLECTVHAEAKFIMGRLIGAIMEKRRGYLSGAPSCIIHPPSILSESVATHTTELVWSQWLTLMLFLLSVGGPSAPPANDFFRFSFTSVSLSSSSTLSSSLSLQTTSSWARRCSPRRSVHTHTHALSCGDRGTAPGGGGGVFWVPAVYLIN